MSDNAIGSIFIGMTAGYAALKSHMDKGAKSIDAITGAATKADGRLGKMAQPKGKGGGFLGDVAGVAARLGVVGAVMGGIRAAGNFFADGIKGASDLNETINKAEVVLGDAAPAAKAFAEQLSTSFGLVKMDVLDSATALGGLGKSLGGLTGAGLSKFTTDMAMLAADLQSVANIPDLKEATQALQIGLSGEQSDTLKRLGVVLNDTTIKEYALAHGMKATKGQLSERDKLTARAAIITEKLAFAHGDLERTAGGAANQFRKAGGGLTNFSVAIGQAMLPAVQAGTVAFNELLGSIVETFEANRPMIEGWAGAIADTFGLVGVVMRNFGSLLEIVQLKAGEFGSNFLAVIATIPANLAIVAEYVGNNWYQLIVDGLNATKAAFLNFSTNLGELANAVFEFLKNPAGGFQFTWTPLLEGFKATAEALPDLIAPELISVQDKIDAITGEMSGREVKHAEAMAGKPAAKQAEAVASAAGAPGEKFAKLAEEGSKEAYSAVIKHRFGDRSGGDSTKKIAKNSDRQVELLEKLAAKGDAGAGAGFTPHINGFAI